MAARSKNPHGQYFTPPAVADLMIGLLRAELTDPVLEPCAGGGVFLDRLSVAGYRDVTAFEIDPELTAASPYPVRNESFVATSGRERFSAVIGNPPYIRWRDLSEASRTEVQRHPLWGTLFNSLSDYLTVFIAAAVEQLCDGGELVFITPSFWMHTQHSQQLRAWLLERGSVTDVVSFGEAVVFTDVASAIVIFRFVKGFGSVRDGGGGIRFARYLGPRRIPQRDLRLDDPSVFEVGGIPGFRPGAHWTLADTVQQDAADAFEHWCGSGSRGTPVRLGDVVDIANGMVSGLDKAFRLSAQELAELSPTERDATLSVVKAADLGRGWAGVTSAYLDIPTGLSEADVARGYPVFHRRLLRFREPLEKRYDYGRELPFWEWAFPRSRTFFCNGARKAVVPCKERLTSRPFVRFALAPPGAVTTQDVTAFAPKAETRESLEYLVAFLTLPQVSDWIRVRGLMKGGVAEFSERPLAAIPIRLIDWDDPAQVRLHDEVTELMDRGAGAVGRGGNPGGDAFGVDLDALLVRVHALLDAR
ncbi:MAG: Eco57I restriction-modification methylase domain-containing protein [Actinomycetes bacterium]